MATTKPKSKKITKKTVSKSTTVKKPTLTERIRELENRLDEHELYCNELQYYINRLKNRCLSNRMIAWYQFIIRYFLGGGLITNCCITAWFKIRNLFQRK